MMSQRGVWKPGWREKLGAAEAALGAACWEEALKCLTAISDLPTYRSGHAALMQSVARRMQSLPAFRDTVADYRAARLARAAERPRLVVYTAIMNRFDSLKLPERPDPRFDYVVFTDTPMSGGGIWDVRLYSAAHEDPRRKARHVKMHPHVLLADYDVAIWIDSNLMILGDIGTIVDTFLLSPAALGAVRHPKRQTVWEEVQACIDTAKDSRDIMEAQVLSHQLEAPQKTPLIESNFLIFRLSDPLMEKFLTLWWRELSIGSVRDQLSFNYAVEKIGLPWREILEWPHAARLHPAFAYVGHDAGAGPAQILVDALDAAYSSSTGVLIAREQGRAS